MVFVVFLVVLVIVIPQVLSVCSYTATPTEIENKAFTSYVLPTGWEEDDVDVTGYAYCSCHNMVTRKCVTFGEVAIDNRVLRTKYYTSGIRASQTGTLKFWANAGGDDCGIPTTEFRLEVYIQPSGLLIGTAEVTGNQRLWKEHTIGFTVPVGDQFRVEWVQQILSLVSYHEQVWVVDDITITMNGVYCDGAGNCESATGTCNCDTGYFGTGGDDCAQCTGTEFCTDHGTCTHDKSSTSCVCTPGQWTGSVCDVPVCNGLNNIDHPTTVCSSVGSCNSPGFCSCDSGIYTGSDCENCVRAACSNSGDCSHTQGTKTCACDAGWTGSICNYPECSTTSGNVASHESFVDVGTPPGWTLQDAYVGASCGAAYSGDNYLMFKNGWTRTAQTKEYYSSGMGTNTVSFYGESGGVGCDQPELEDQLNVFLMPTGQWLGRLTTPAGWRLYSWTFSNLVGWFYFEFRQLTCMGPSTDVWIIDDFTVEVASGTVDCSGVGYCTAANTCSCPSVFYGVTADDCGLCYDSVCNDHGSCSHTNGEIACTCLPTYTGERCEIPICNGKNNVDDPSTVCNSIGSCDSPNSCLCDGAWGDFFGNDCESCSNSYCLWSGTCSHVTGDRSCVCLETYEGEICDERICNHTIKSFSIMEDFSSFPLNWVKTENGPTVENTCGAMSGASLHLRWNDVQPTAHYSAFGNDVFVNVSFWMNKGGSCETGAITQSYGSLSVILNPGAIEIGRVESLANNVWTNFNFYAKTTGQEDYCYVTFKVNGGYSDSYILIDDLEIDVEYDVKCDGTGSCTDYLTCTCDTGFSSEGTTSGNCLLCSDDIICYGHGECSNADDGLKCTCEPGWVGRFCDVAICYGKNEFSDPEIVCGGVHGSCVAPDDCECGYYFIGDECDDCTCDYQNQICTATEGSTSRICECLPGFTGYRCEDVDLEYCLDSNSQYVHKDDLSVCSDRQGACSDGICNCFFGFSGTYCEYIAECGEIEFDDPSVCNENGVCEIPDGEITFSCTCDEGFGGEFCVPQSSNAGAAVGITFGVLGGICAVIICVCVIIVGFVVLGCAARRKAGASGDFELRVNEEEEQSRSMSSDFPNNKPVPSFEPPQDESGGNVVDYSPKHVDGYTADFVPPDNMQQPIDENSKAKELPVYIPSESSDGDGYTYY